MLHSGKGFYEILSWDRHIGQNVDQPFDHGVGLLSNMMQVDVVRDLQ